jgi:hypothetical protein
MSHLNLIAILEPLPGKVDRVNPFPYHAYSKNILTLSQVVEILSEIAAATQSDEPTCLRYEITRHTDEETKTEQVIMIEA